MTGVNTDPGLGPGQDDGGPTFTHALLTGSPAVDASPVDNGCPETDQRVVPRPRAAGAGTQRRVSRPQGTLCDIDVVEQTPRPTIRSFTLAGGAVGASIAVTAPIWTSPTP